MELEKFKEIFWDAFHRPNLQSEQFQKLFEQIEPINDLLAGPLFAIYKHDDCDYIFRDKQRFPDIHDIDDFLNWCVMLAEKYKAEILALTADKEDEREDKQLLLFQTDMKMELIELAYIIQTNRMTKEK